jgi:hypothetical protein
MTADRGGPLAHPAPELYDLRADPQQLENLARSDDPATKALRGRLADRLFKLRRCGGIKGRDPRGPHHFCE